MKKRIIYIMGLLGLLSAVAYAQTNSLSAGEIGATIKESISVIKAISAAGFVPWIKENIIVFILLLLGVFSIVAKLTPTDKDDKILSKIFKVVNVLGLSKSPK